MSGAGRPATQVVIVAYRSPLWIRVSVGSFRRHFPGQRVLVVDNNPRPGDPRWDPACEVERAWLAAQPDVEVLRNEGGDRRHGRGMDLALAWCRARGVDAMLHVDSDCRISGAGWYHNLVGAIAGGAWMAAIARKPWGPLHPSVSIWDVREVRASFERCDALADAQQPCFAELVDIERFAREPDVEGDPRHTPWKWDTGIKAWFEAARRDRAVLVPGPGIAHYWYGSHGREQYLHLFLDPRLLRYTRPAPHVWARHVGGALAGSLREHGVRGTVAAAADQLRRAITLRRQPH